MGDDVEKAVIYAFDQSGAVSPDLRERALGYLKDLQATPDAWRGCVGRYQATAYPEVRFWCLQTLADAVSVHLPGLDPNDAAALRANVASWVHEACVGREGHPPVPAFIKNKLAQVTARMVAHEYPARWPGFFRELIGLLQSAGPGGADVFCRVLDAVDDEVISTGDTLTHAAARSATGTATGTTATSVRVKDAMREDGDVLAQLAETWRAMVEYGSGGGGSPQLAAAAAATARRYVEWMDIGGGGDNPRARAPFSNDCVNSDAGWPTRHFTSDAFVSAVLRLLGSSDGTLRAAGADFLIAMVSKGMDHGAKVALISTLGLVGVCRQLQAASTRVAKGGGDDDESEETETLGAQLAAGVGQELFACTRAAAAAAAEAKAGKAPDAPPPAPEACAAAAAMIDELIPVGVAHLRSANEGAVMAALPLCTAYVNGLKDQFAAEQMPAASRANAEGALRMILDAVITRSAFPEDAGGGGTGSALGAGVDFSDGTSKATREAEMELMALRQELAVLFRAVARLAPPLATEAVGRTLAAALPPPPAPPPPWQLVETALSALHLVGEGANDAAVKPGAEASPLGDLVEFLIERWAGGGDRPTTGGPAGGISGASRGDLGTVPAATQTHRLVASAFLDLCVRYHLAVSRKPGTLLGPALAAFLDHRGMRHPSAEVSRRACYLFCRFVKPLRGQIVERLPEVLAAMEGVLREAGVVDAGVIAGSGSGGGGSSGGSGGGTGGAMATAGNDDRLYAFEAFGVLLGIDDVPEELQVRYLEAVCGPLRGRIEAATARGAFPSDAAEAQHAVVALSNVAKGFPQRMATVSRPKIGEILRAGLEPALRCLAVWPRDPLTRQRVLGFFQRLVQGIGSQVFPYALPLVTHLRTEATPGDLRECLVLINQLMATFKTDLGPFLAEVLPVMIRQVAAALAPFAGADGPVLGVKVAGGGGAGGTTGGPARPELTHLGGTDNTEEAREARELEKTFILHVTRVAVDGLAGVLAADGVTRDAVLATLTAVASAHPSAGVRKSALQALTKLADHWLPTAEQTAAGMAEPVPGFRAFAAETVAGECCALAVLRGDVDLRDAACAAVVAEAVTFQRLMLERCGDDFARHLVGAVLAPLGLDAAVGGEYVRVVKLGTPKEARAFISECQRVVATNAPGAVQQRRRCARS